MRRFIPLTVAILAATCGGVAAGGLTERGQPVCWGLVHCLGEIETVPASATHPRLAARGRVPEVPGHVHGSCEGNAGTTKSFRRSHRILDQK